MWFLQIVCLSGFVSCLMDADFNTASYEDTKPECEEMARSLAVSKHERTGREYGFFCYRSTYEPIHLERR